MTMNALFMFTLEVISGEGGAQQISLRMFSKTTFLFICLLI